MCGRSVCPKFGCAVTLVGHFWNSMWLVAWSPQPKFSWWGALCAGGVAVELASSASLMLSSPAIPLLKFLLFKFLLHLLWLHFLSDFCHPLYYYCVVNLFPLLVLPMPWRLCRRLAVCRSCSVIRAAFSRLGTNGWAPVGWLPGLLFLVPPFNHCLLHLALCWWKEMPFHPISWNDFSFRVVILSPSKWKVTAFSDKQMTSWETWTLKDSLQLSTFLDFFLEVKQDMNCEYINQVK